jgi:hypothetical protein
MSTADPVSDLPLTQLLAISGLGRQTERDDEAALFGDPTVVCSGTPDDVVARRRQHMIGVAQLKSESSSNQDDDSGAAVVDGPTFALVPNLMHAPLGLERWCCPQSGLSWIEERSNEPAGGMRAIIGGIADDRLAIGLVGHDSPV